MALDWKMGFEIELMAPPGRSRLDLAERVARRHDGRVRRFFHPQSEPSAVQGLPTFENLTLGFEALDAGGAPLGRFVDDLTLQEGLDKKTPPRPGWYRIVADDARLLRLAMHNCDAEAPLAEALVPLARLFGSEPEPHVTGMVRVSDDRGVSVAIGAPLPGERERPCEVVTPPLATGQAAALDMLLGEARAMGCSIPAEGATHIHFDGEKLTSAIAIANLVNALMRHGPALKTLVATNPRCVRLGTWPDALGALVNGANFAALPWPKAREALGSVGLKKFCDFNLLNIATANPAKHTFEVRILPVALESAPILAAAALFEAILHWSCTDTLRTAPDSLSAWLAALNLPPEGDVWRNRAAGA